MAKRPDCWMHLAADDNGRGASCPASPVPFAAIPRDPTVRSNFHSSGVKLDLSATDFTALAVSPKASLM